MLGWPAGFLFALLGHQALASLFAVRRYGVTVGLLWYEGVYVTEWRAWPALHFSVGMRRAGRARRLFSGITDGVHEQGALLILCLAGTEPIASIGALLGPAMKS